MIITVTNVTPLLFLAVFAGSAVFYFLLAVGCAMVRASQLNEQDDVDHEGYLWS